MGRGWRCGGGVRRGGVARATGGGRGVGRGVPAVAIDSVNGGSKLLRQMRRIGWPLAFHVGEVDRQKIEKALDFALTADARQQAAVCAASAAADVQVVKQQFLTAFKDAR